ncbi:BPTI/Kunitz domain-containing protein [Siphateles boraxobius]|uniref:BPTI/Kunitz domain-containing protein n=1 Tax=Siphateles boraxobius TaxID=180520 RepID=UPI0040641857
MSSSTMYVLMVVLGFGGVCVFTLDPACTDVRDEGNGTEKMLKYCYDSQAQLCVPFFYKGEGGSRNRFDSDKDCMKACSPKGDQMYPDDEMACSLPKDKGACFAMIPKHYYDNEEKDCRMFFYGGCQGNANRFDSREDCHKLCLARSGRLFGAADLPNPDEKGVSAGLIVGVLGGIVFVGAVISAIVMFVLHKKSKKAERKPVPTSDIEMK